MPHVLFLDESGDHSLSKIDPEYPLFVLCGVLMDEDYHNTIATEALNRFKMELFGRTDIVLHTADFTRNQLGFEQMKDPGFRKRFFGGLENLIALLGLQVIACAIRKQEHLTKYGIHALDPYMLSLSLVVERFIFEVGSQGGTIVAESRDDTLNNALELAFLDLKIRGTQFVAANRIRDRVRSFAFRGKRENLAGLQIADVLATPIGRHVLGKLTYAKDCPSGDFWNSIEPKLRRDWRGNTEGMGLVVLPK